MATKIKIRRDTSQNWNSYDPILADGEPALDKDSLILKIGDGKSKFSQLPAVNLVTGAPEIINADEYDGVGLNKLDPLGNGSGMRLYTFANTLHGDSYSLYGSATFRDDGIFGYYLVDSKVGRSGVEHGDIIKVKHNIINKTVSMWIKFDSSKITSETEFMKTCYQGKDRFCILPDGKVKKYWDPGDGTHSAIINCNLPFDEWFLLFIDNGVNYYVFDQLSGSGGGNGYYATRDESNQFYVGNNGVSICQLRIFNKILSTSEKQRMSIVGSYEVEAISNKIYLINNKNANTTIKLPPNPANGCFVKIRRHLKNDVLRLCWIDGNGYKINGSTERYKLTPGKFYADLIFVDNDYGWAIISGG